MKSEVSLANTSFGFLKGSSDFLNILLNNINSCVLLLNNRMELYAFNNALKTIFSNKKDEDILYNRCGEVIGCAHHVEEAKDCGTTSQCSTCDLRVSAIESYASNKPIYKEYFTRPFYDANFNKIQKQLQFSTRIFPFKNEKYIILIIDDISKHYKAEESVIPT